MAGLQPTQCRLTYLSQCEEGLQLLHVSAACNTVGYDCRTKMQAASKGGMHPKSDGGCTSGIVV